MTASAFEELEEKSPEIVESMDPKFNSHVFILELAQRHQRLYIQALNGYIATNQPFKTVHREIAKRLKKCENLVKYVGRAPSKNIFGYNSYAALWEKVKK